MTRWNGYEIGHSRRRSGNWSIGCNPIFQLIDPRCCSIWIWRVCPIFPRMSAGGWGKYKYQALSLQVRIVNAQTTLPDVIFWARANTISIWDLRNHLDSFSKSNWQTHFPRHYFVGESFFERSSIRRPPLSSRMFLPLGGYHSEGMRFMLVLLCVCEWVSEWVSEWENELVLCKALCIDIVCQTCYMMIDLKKSQTCSRTISACLSCLDPKQFPVMWRRAILSSKRSMRSVYSIIRSSRVRATLRRISKWLRKFRVTP